MATTNIWVGCCIFPRHNTVRVHVHVHVVAIWKNEFAGTKRLDFDWREREREREEAKLSQAHVHCVQRKPL